MRLSVVLPAGGTELLEAVLGSEGAGVEIVRIEDSSCAARNQALDEAQGDYLWFLGPQDVLLPGALAQVTERLEATAPDVLCVHHAAIDARGRVRERRPSPAAAPHLFDTVLRRDHLRALGVRFVDGRYGDLPVTWPALLAAGRIEAAPATRYVHVQPDSRDGSPFDVFGAYDATFAALPVPQRQTLVPAMLEHQFRLLNQVGAARRREFFGRMSEGLRRHRTGDEPPPAGRLGRTRRELLERDAYAAFRLLETSRRARPAAVRRSRRAVRRARRARLDRYYRARLDQPLDPELAVYQAYWGRGYACNPRAIHEKARELVPNVRGVWVVRADAVDRLPAGVEYVVERTREYFDVVARAGYLVNNVNFPNFLVKRAGSVHVQTHHGTPLKHMGLDQRGTPVSGRRMDFDALLRRCERWDLSISQNEFSTRIWERVYPTGFESLEAGYPRNDVLANSGEEEVARIRGELGIDPGQTAVLYAPTHREYQPGYVPVLDLARVADGLGADHVVLARLHYFYDADPRLRELHRAGRIRDVAAHPSVEELCLAADALVTDYSSIMFDYAVLDRPIVVHAPDWEVYRAMRGAYFDLLAEGPGVVTRTETEVIDAIVSRSAWGADAADRLAAFRARFCSLDDGRAAERVVRRLWLGEGEPQASRGLLGSSL